MLNLLLTALNALHTMNPSPTFHAPTDPSLSMPPSGAGRIRATGWALIVLGPCISAAMALAAHTLFGTIATDRLTGRHPQWHGSPDFTRTAAELFGAVFLLGIAISLGGVYQVRKGRRSPALIALVLGLAAVTVYLVCGVIAQPTQR